MIYWYLHRSFDQKFSLPVDQIFLFWSSDLIYRPIILSFGQKSFFQLIESFFLSYFNTWFDLLVLTPVIWSKVLSSGRSNLSLLIKWFDLLTHAFVTWLKVLFLSWSNLSFFLIWSSDLIYWNWHWSFDQNSSCPVDQIFRSFFYD